MNRRHDAGRLTLFAALAAGTTWLALIAWSAFIEPPADFLGPLAVMALAVAGLGVGLRTVAMPQLVVVPTQAFLAVVLLCRHVTGSAWPSPNTLADLGEALQASMESAQQFAAPIGPNAASVAPLLLTAGLALVLLVDLLAVGMRRVPLIGLVLLGIYAVPAGIPTGASMWASFAAAAVGFLALLHLDARERLDRWGQPITDDRREESGINPLAEAIRTGAGRIGAVTVALALAAGLVVPVLELDLIGAGRGGGVDEIRIHKPVVDMRRDLMRPADRPLLNVVTDDPAPRYLRIAVLNRYTGAEWSSGDRSVSSANRARGALPEPDGVASAVPRREWHHQVRVRERFDSTWLPTQFPAASVVADGDWRFDPRTMDFLASGGQSTAGLSYTMTAIEHDFGSDGRWFRDAAPGAVDPEFLELPGGVPDSVQAWTDRVTADARTDHERAVQLQQWFRSEFHYSLERAPEGTGNQTLAGFLARSGRVGYCEQFASAMAVMARLLGIPSRVAVGFLQPTREEDGSWTYSSHDLHAWPELYFNGTGWVRFEPTPAARAEQVPAYSEPRDDSSPSVPDPTGDPTERPTEDPPPPTDPAPPDSEESADLASDNVAPGSGAAATLALALLGLLALLLTAAAPRALRSRLRRRRLAAGPEGVWEEVRATTVDLGQPWPTGRSPRETATILLSRSATSLPEPAFTALERLVRAVEAGRYARPGTTTPHRQTAADDGTEFLGALTAAATDAELRRARWWPRSLPWWPLRARDSDRGIGQ